MKIPTTPLAAGATVGAGVGAAALNPALGASVAGLGALYGGYKGVQWLSTPMGRQWLIKMIKYVENDPLLSKYKIDKAAMVSLLQDIRENPDTPEDEDELEVGAVFGDSANQMFGGAA